MNLEQQAIKGQFNSRQAYYSRQGLWSLFLMCAFPLHLWTILLAFRDFSWLIDRSGLWAAISVMSYGLIFAFIESILVFLVAVLLGFLISRYWGQDRRIALISILVFSLNLYAIATQLYFLLQLSTPELVMRILAVTSHPIRLIYVVAFVFVLLITLLITYFVLRLDKFLQFIQGLIDRFSLLMNFYLVLDVIGVIIIILRNMHGR